MPAPAYKSLPHRALLWKKAGDDRYGQPYVSAPVEIVCRWMDKLDEEMSPQASTTMISATATVVVDVPVGSYIWKAPDGSQPGDALAFWGGTGSGALDEELCEVKSFNATADFKGRSQTRTVAMMRLHNKGQAPSAFIRFNEGVVGFDGKVTYGA